MVIKTTKASKEAIYLPYGALKFKFVGLNIYFCRVYIQVPGQHNEPIDIYLQTMFLIGRTLAEAAQDFIDRFDNPDLAKHLLTRIKDALHKHYD